MVYKWDCTFHNWGHKWHHVTYNGHNPSTAWGFGSLGVTNGCVWNFGIPSEKGHWIIEYMGMIQTYPLELGVANWRSQIEILQRKMVVLNKLCMGKPGVWTCFWRCSGCELAGKKVEIGRCNSVKSVFFSEQDILEWIAKPETIGDHLGLFSTICVFCLISFGQLNHLKGLAQKAWGSCLMLHMFPLYWYTSCWRVVIVLACDIETENLWWF